MPLIWEKSFVFYTSSLVTDERLSYETNHFVFWCSLLRTDRVNIINPKYYITLKWPNFQRPTVIYMPTDKECFISVLNASFDIFEAKLVDFLFQNQPSKFSRKFKLWLWTLELTNFSFECAKRSVTNDIMTFLCSFNQNNQF